MSDTFDNNKIISLLGGASLIHIKIINGSEAEIDSYIEQWLALLKAKMTPILAHKSNRRSILDMISILETIVLKSKYPQVILNAAQEALDSIKNDKTLLSKKYD